MYCETGINLGHASPRIPGICSFLNEWGWKAYIVTPAMSSFQQAIFLPNQASGFEILPLENWPLRYRAPLPILSRIYKAIIRLSRLHRLFIELLDYPDPEYKWIPLAVTKITTIMGQLQFNLVLSSSSPVSAHIIADTVKSKYGVPWIADLRDLWTQNHCYSYCKRRRIKERELEIATLRGADTILTVTPQWVTALRQLHNSNILCLPNGFFPRAAYAQKTTKKSEEFQIIYTGQIYPGKQDLNCFFLALDKLFKSNRVPANVVSFVYRGNSVGYVNSIFKQHYVGRTPGFRINIDGSISRDQTYKMQQEADVLLLLNWEDKEEKGVAPTKFYEYLSAAKPILACGGHEGGIVYDILSRSKAGFYCTTPDEVASKIQMLYEMHILGKKPLADVRKEVIDEFSYPRLAKKLACIMDQLIASKTRNYNL